MKAIDPRELSDIDLLLYVAMGPLPRSGWSGRNRVIARRLAEFVAVAAAVLAGFGIFVWVMWAAFG